MPVNFLTEAERLRFNSFPANLSNEDLIAHFTLSDVDLMQIPVKTIGANQLGFTLHLLTLRFLGFYISDLKTIPKSVIEFVSSQIRISPDEIKQYGNRRATRAGHKQIIEKYLDFRQPTKDDFRKIENWLTQRALEHDRPILLLQLLCDRFLGEKIVRPGLSVIERMVATARNSAQEELFERLSPIVNESLESDFKNLLQSEEPNQPTQLAWFRKSATTNSPKTILEGLDKFERLELWNVSEWDLSALNPNRRKQLAQIGFRSTAQAISRMNKKRRYPILLAFFSQLYEEVLDELVELFDRLLQNVNAKTERKLIELNYEISKLANNKIKLLQNIVEILLNPKISDEDLRRRIYQIVPEEKLRTTIDECERLNETNDNNYFQILGKRYSYIRQFIPTFLNALPLDGNAKTAGLRRAINILREMDQDGRRKVPEDAPIDFIPAKWFNSIFDEKDKIIRKFYELCVLFELRSNLRSGDIWVEGSRRYAKLDSYLIPSEKWDQEKIEICSLLRLPENAEIRINERRLELESLYQQFDDLFEPRRNQQKDKNKNKSSDRVIDFNQNFDKKSQEEDSESINVRLENNKLIITKLAGEKRSDSSLLLEQIVSERLPEVELTDILIEVDSWTRFSRYFQHPNGKEPRSRDALANCYAGILAQACNFGLIQMSRMSGITYRKLAWHTTWYLREETLKSAFSELVNFHNRQHLAKIWGGGTLSSSDGQRFPVSVKARNAVSIPKYFGYGRGLTYYTWTSDQYSQYGTKVIPSTIRDATYVLDEILDNETELTILEHTTDTAGYTDLVFGLFDLLGLQFSPRLADLADQNIYCFDKTIKYKNINSLISEKIKTDLILRHWDDLLKIAGSLKKGYVTASLFISKLQSFKQKNALTKTLQEYGRIQKTIFILKYLQSPEYQKKITAQLNKGEAMHALRNFLFVAGGRKINKRDQENQLNQAACLNLVVNAVTVWNTVYIQAVIDQLRTEGYEIKSEDIANLSPARSEHINVYGKYYFNVEEGLSRKGLRELRKPEQELWRKTA